MLLFPEDFGLISLTEQKNFQPMNANFGLLPAIDIRDKKRKKEMHGERSLAALKGIFNKDLTLYQKASFTATSEVSGMFFGNSLR